MSHRWEGYHQPHVVHKTTFSTHFIILIVVFDTHESKWVLWALILGLCSMSLGDSSLVLDVNVVSSCVSCGTAQAKTQHDVVRRKDSFDGFANPVVEPYSFLDRGETGSPTLYEAGRSR